MKPRFLSSLVMLLLCGGLWAQSSQLKDLGLFNTGEGSTNTYTLVSSPYSGSSVAVSLYEPANTVWPINGVWLDNVTTGNPANRVRWLAVGFADTTPATARVPTVLAGDYTIRLAFDIGTLDPATLGFTIHAAADNRLVTKLNDFILPNYGTASGDVNYSSLASYSYTVAGLGSGLHAGANYIDFVVTNVAGGGDNPVGLYVTFSDFTTAVPEPSTYALLLGLSTGALVYWRRRQRQRSF